MSNLTRRSETTRGMEPWRDFFDIDIFDPRFPSARNMMPAVNLSEDDKTYTVDVVAPGYKKDDFTLKVDDDVLTISAETKNERTEGGDGREYSRREYSRSSLPVYLNYRIMQKMIAYLQNIMMVFYRSIFQRLRTR